MPSKGLSNDHLLALKICAPLKNRIFCKNKVTLKIIHYYCIYDRVRCNSNLKLVVIKSQIKDSNIQGFF